MITTVSPLISIIVPVFNIEKDLPFCIDSVLKQSFDNFELILIDDGSTDSSGNICDNYKKKDSRIVVLHKNNGGVSDSRNEGLRIAKGKYISFIDGDDLVHKDFLQILLDSIYGCEMAMCFFSFFRNTDPDLISKKPFLKKDVTEHEFWDTNYGVGLRASCCNKLFLSSLFRTVCFDKNFAFAEDDLIIHRLTGQCSRIAIIDATLYFYRARDNSLTHTRSNVGTIRNEALVFLDRCYYYLERNDIYLMNKWYIKCFTLLVDNYDKIKLKKERKLLKKIYLYRKKRNYLCIGTERLFFTSPTLLYLLRKCFKGNKN